MMNKPRQGSIQPFNPALERLGVFIGEWKIEITSIRNQADKTAAVGGRATFDWIEERAFLIEHFEISNPDFPRGISILGPDDSAETYSMLYFDSRGVSRIYQMSFTNGVWNLWRDFPGFSQRFIGTFSEDGKIINGRWEMSSDGSNWELDFNMMYTKIS